MAEATSKVNYLTNIINRLKEFSVIFYSDYNKMEPALKNYFFYI